MRFDEVSARYGEFGTFFVGNILPDEKVENFTHINREKERNSFLFIPSIFLLKNFFFRKFEQNRQILLNTLQNCNLSISKFMLKWYELYANNDAKVIMYMKKIFSILLVFLLSISSLGVTTSHAEEKIHIEAAAALLFDADTGKILHEQNPDELLAIASMSKLIVVYAVLEAIKEGKITWDTKVNISDYAYEVSRNNEFSNVPFEKGRQYTVRELYHSIVIFSANGSSIALAELLAGSEKNFLNLANEHAKTRVKEI